MGKKRSRKGAIDPKSGSALDSGQVDFHYIKSPAFRVLHVDGAIGGLTPKGLISMDLWSERPAMPQFIRHELSPNGLGPEIKTDGKQGFVRDVEASLLFDVQTAESFLVWLKNWIDTKKRIDSQKQAQSSASK